MVSTVLLAGYNMWGIEVDGLLDCDIPLHSTEEELLAEVKSYVDEEGKRPYKGKRIVTTKDAEHYSNA